MASTFLRNTLLGFTSGGAVALAGFVGNAITARLLGPESLGAFSYIVWCVTISSFLAGLGISVVQQRYIPNLRAEGRDEEADGLIGAVTRVSIAAALVGAILLFAYLYWPAKNATAGSSSTAQLIVVGLALVWFVWWKMGDLYLFHLRGEQRFGELAKLSGWSALIKVAVITLGAWLFGVPGAIAGYIAGNILPAVRVRRLLRIKPKVSSTLRQEVVKFAAASWAAAVIGALVFGRTEIVFLQHYSGLEAVGLFAAAATVAEMAVQLPPLLLSALMPRLSEQFGLGAHDEMLRLYRTMTAFMALVILPLCLGLAAVSPVLVPVFFGDEFSGAIPATSVLLIAAAISSLGVTTFYLLQSMGKTGFLLISNGIGLVGTIALGFVLVPRFGLIGAAYSRGIVQVGVVLIETWYVTRRLHLTPPFRALGAITLAALAQGAVAYFVSIEWGGAISLVASIPAAAVVYLVALRVLAVMPMIDPGLAHRLVERAPGRLQPVIGRLLNLPTSAPTDHIEPSDRE